MQMVIEREDGTRQLFKDPMEMMKLPIEDLQVLQRLVILSGPFKAEGHARFLAKQPTEEIKKKLSSE